MPENMLTIPEDTESSCDACLMVDKTAAFVLVSPGSARNLYDRFRNSGLSCSLLPGHDGKDVIDLRHPSPDEARRIRTVFASLAAEAGWEEKSLDKCVWLVLLVVALWLVSMLASG